MGRELNVEVVGSRVMHNYQLCSKLSLFPLSAHIVRYTHYPHNRF